MTAIEAWSVFGIIVMMGIYVVYDIKTSCRHVVGEVCRVCGGRPITEVEKVVREPSCGTVPGCNGSGYGCTGDPNTCVASEAFKAPPQVEEVSVTYLVFPDGRKVRQP